MTPLYSKKVNLFRLVTGFFLFLVLFSAAVAAAGPVLVPGIARPTPVAPDVPDIVPHAIREEGTGRQFMAGEILVRFQGDNEADIQEVSARLNKGIGASVRKNFSALSLPGLQVVSLPATITVTDAVRYYSESGAVLYAEPNYVLHRIEPVRPGARSLSPAGSSTLQASSTSKTSSTREQLAAVSTNDQYFNKQWGLNAISAPDAWNINKGSPEVVIAVIDSGVDTSHPDLVANIWRNSRETRNGRDDDGNGYIDDIVGYDFFSGATEPTDIDGHGTACAGIIAASTNNGIGIAGTMWDARIMALKVGPSYTDVAAELDAIDYASRMGASIILCSFGAYDYIRAEHDVIQAAPALFVCAAGNDGTDNDMRPTYPASYDCPNIISVAASDRAGHLTDGTDDFRSNYGLRTVDVAAPGTEIVTTTPGGRYSTGSGTSFAAPYVAGVAGLVKSQNPGLSSLEIKDIILSTVDTSVAMKGMIGTGGRVNAYRALIQAGGSQVVGAPTVVATPPVVHGTLTITSNPPLAIISVNGAYAGITPKVLSELPAGTYRIVIQKNGYENWEQTVEIADGITVTLEAQLTRSETQQGTTIPGGLRPSSYPTPAGTASTTLRPPGYPGSSTTVVPAVTPGAVLYPNPTSSSTTTSSQGVSTLPSTLPMSLPAVTPVSPGVQGATTGVPGLAKPVTLKLPVLSPLVYSPAVRS